MTIARRELAADLPGRSGTVVVSRTLRAPAEKVWRALTDPPLVSAWFGDLTAPLDGGGSARLEFGDGDFFLLEDVRLDPPRSLRYSWRFLGVGPRDDIRWTLAPAGEHCVVTVTDGEEERTPEDALQLRKGWLDFTRRLRDHLSNGENTRYPWRHDFDGGIELPCDAARARKKLFSPPAQAHWLPLAAGATLSDGAWFHPADGEEPARLRVTHVEWESPDHVSFRLAASDWDRPTLCRLQLSARAQTTLLSISHRGWKLIGADRHYQKQQRRRFCQLWVHKLVEARRLTTLDE
jgi:uncharacterized protein YndB with AHSA1/START domain